MTLYKRKYARKGQGLVEFALVLPFLLMLAFGIIDFAQVSFTFAQAQNSLREAVRLANVFGYPGSSVPSYLACTNIEQTAENIFFATSAEAKVSYVKSRVGAKTPAPGNWAIGDTFECGSSPYGTETNGKSNLQNGDIMKIELDVTINFITPFLSSAYPAFDMHFEAQRTIVKDIRLGGDNDRDGDGLDDCWEEIHFGTPPIDCTDDDYSAIEIWDAFSDPDLDGCNNGCEETHMLDPNNPDTDGDGLKDGEEIYVYGTNPKNEDTDGDDLLDGQEVYGNHPNNTHGYITDPLLWSTDEDCLSDGDEIIIHKTNPLVADTDGDEEDDCEEVGGGTDPNNQDTDSDGLTDGEERNVYLTDPFNPDTDGDGLLDGYEVHTSGTNPNLFDTDGDSMGDGDELRFHNGIENNPAPYNVGGYASDPLKEHSDNDSPMTWKSRVWSLRSCGLSMKILQILQSRKPFIPIPNLMILMAMV
jgi:hypothetical protein